MPFALITGAGSGIGRATAVMLSSRGYGLALAGRREDRLRETCDLCGERGETLVLAADLRERAQTLKMVDDAVARFGRLDVLINNAGLAPMLPVEKHTPELIEEVYAINAVAPALATWRAWPVFVRQRSGCIVNLSTMGTLDPFNGFFAYAAAKAAVNLQALCAAREGAGHGIRAFAVAPGAVETEMLRAIVGEDILPRSQTLRAEDVARVIVACVEGERDAENGKVIVVAGDGSTPPG
jgi:NAD(P)-dependent dehydrogenase (short-subunit alcohol dehydrogenase family)